MDEKHIRRLPGWFYFFGFLLLLILFILSSIESADAQQPNPQACDAMVTDLIPLITQKQEEHFIFYGSLFQGLPTHIDPPANSVEPDNAYTHPTDQPVTWYEFLGEDMPDKMPCRFTIDIYDGPNGRGYDVIIEYADSTMRQPDPVVCNRIESKGAQSRGRGKGWSCQ